MPIRIDYLTPETIEPYWPMTWPLTRTMLASDDEGSMALGARDGDRPIGLILGKLTGWNQTGEILSVFVDPAYRGKGVGAALMRYLEEGFAELGMTRAKASFNPETAEMGPLQRLLAKRGWSEPEDDSVVCVSTAGMILAAPWMDYPALDDDYAIGLWKDTGDEDREDIERRQRETAWIPDDLFPFPQDQGCDPATSVYLRYQGKIVGWVITHRWGPQALYYTCSYMRPDLQKLGRIVPLYADSLRRMKRAGIPYGIWAVPMHHRAMVAFTRRRMAPHSLQTAEMKGTSKALGGPAS